jgi:D-aminoacyl-tRNA deacylase
VIFIIEKKSKVKVVLQRVKEASVLVNNKIVSAITNGLLLFVGIEDEDNMEDIIWLSNKIVNLRIFDDADKIPNLSVKEINGELLIVSQFTLQANIKKGNRPSYIKASKPDIAIPIYNQLLLQLETDFQRNIQSGIFGADMQVHLINDGPFTLFIDTKNKI